MEDINKIKLLINYDNRLTLTENKSLITEASIVNGLLDFLKDGAKYLSITDFPNIKTSVDFEAHINKIKAANTVDDIRLLGNSVDYLLQKFDYKDWAENILKDPVSPILTPNELNSVVDNAVNKLINSKIPLTDELNNISKDLDTKLKNLWPNNTWDDNYKELVKQVRIKIKGKIIAKLKTNNPKIFKKYVEDMSRPIIRKFLNNKELGVLLKMLKDTFVKTNEYLPKIKKLFHEYIEQRELVSGAGLDDEADEVFLRMGELIENINAEMRILKGKEVEAYDKVVNWIKSRELLAPEHQKKAVTEFIAELKAKPGFDSAYKIADFLKFNTAEWKQLKAERVNTYRQILNWLTVKRWGTYNNMIKSHPGELSIFGSTNIYDRFLKPLKNMNLPLVFRNLFMELTIKMTGIALGLGFVETVIELLIYISYDEENAKKFHETAGLLRLAAEPFTDYKEYNFMGIDDTSIYDNAWSIVVNLLRNTLENVGLSNLIGTILKLGGYGMGGLTADIKAKKDKIIELNKTPNLEERRKKLESFLSEERTFADKLMNVLFNEENSISKQILLYNTGRESNPNQTVVDPKPADDNTTTVDTTTADTTRTTRWKVVK